MNFLQLCQRVQLLLRSATGLVGTTPTTTVSQSGDLLEIVTFVNMAYQDIQSRHRVWKFMVGEGSFNTVNGTREYTISSSIATYGKLLPYMAQDERPYILLYTSSVGVSDEAPVWFTPYPEWAGGVLDRGTASTGRPSRYTIKPDGKIAFDPTPDAVYVPTFNYRKALDTLSGDTDEPWIPAEYHMAIVWLAVKYYYVGRGGTSEFYQKVDREYAKELRRLVNDQLPEVVMEETWSHP